MDGRDRAALDHLRRRLPLGRSELRRRDLSFYITAIARLGGRLAQRHEPLP